LRRSQVASLVCLALASISWSGAPTAQPAGSPEPEPAGRRPAPLAVQQSSGVVRAPSAVAQRLANRARTLLPAEIAPVAKVLTAEAAARDLDPWLVLAVIEVESGFDPFAVSPVGALGLMQVMPSTGESIAQRLGIPWQGPRTLFDPVANLRIGIAYLQELRDRFGRLGIALAAYNRGPALVDRRVRAGQPVPASYARRVLATYAESAPTDARAS